MIWLGLGALISGLILVGCLSGANNGRALGRGCIRSLIWVGSLSLAFAIISTMNLWASAFLLMGFVMMIPYLVLFTGVIWIAVAILRSRAKERHDAKENASDR